MSADLKRRLRSRKTRRRVLSGLGAGAVGVAGLWWFTGRPTVKETSDVQLKTGQFRPRNIRVPTGTEVEWSNVDQFAHTVTADSPNWEFDETVEADREVSYTFEESGVYKAICKIHDNDSMKIAVGDATIEEPLGGWF